MPLPLPKDWTLMKMLLQITLLFLIGAQFATKAQERSASSPATESAAALCNEEVFENAESLFRVRHWRQSWFKAERELKEVVRFCPDTVGG
jgi:hypothetical protein